jgi:hypothetical protein
VARLVGPIMLPCSKGQSLCFRQWDAQRPPAVRLSPVLCYPMCTLLPKAQWPPHCSQLASHRVCCCCCPSEARRFARCSRRRCSWARSWLACFLRAFCARRHFSSCTSSASHGDTGEYLRRACSTWHCSTSLMTAPHGPARFSTSSRGCIETCNAPAVAFCGEVTRQPSTVAAPPRTIGKALLAGGECSFENLFFKG